MVVNVDGANSETECAFLAGFRCRIGHITSDIADLSVEVLAKRQLEIEEGSATTSIDRASRPQPLTIYLLIKFTRPFTILNWKMEAALLMLTW